MTGKAVVLCKKNMASPQGLGKDFFKAPKALALEGRIDKFDYINMDKASVLKRLLFQR